MRARWWALPLAVAYFVLARLAFAGLVQADESRWADSIASWAAEAELVQADYSPIEAHAAHMDSLDRMLDPLRVLPVDWGEDYSWLADSAENDSDYPGVAGVPPVPHEESEWDSVEFVFSPDFDTIGVPVEWEMHIFVENPFSSGDSLWVTATSGPLSPAPPDTVYVEVVREIRAGALFWLCMGLLGLGFVMGWRWRRDGGS